VVELALHLLGPGRFVVTTLEDESVAAVKARFPEVPAALSLGGAGSPTRGLPC
jgi:glycerophosphoryl diester phosphodiesterase